MNLIEDDYAITTGRDFYVFVPELYGDRGGSQQGIEEVKRAIKAVITD